MFRLLRAAGYVNTCTHVSPHFVFEKKQNKQSLSSEEFVCVEVLQLNQPNGVMSSVVNLPNHTFTGKA